jgi:hypothetical protein
MERSTRRYGTMAYGTKYGTQNGTKYRTRAYGTKYGTQNISTKEYLKVDLFIVEKI